MNDETPSIVLPLIGTALCTVFLGLALGYCAMVDDEVYLLTDDEDSELAEQCAEQPDSVAVAGNR